MNLSSALRTLEIIVVSGTVAILPVMAASTTITGPTIVPASIDFTASDPDAAPIGGSSVANVIWGMQGGLPSSDWALRIHSASPALLLCPDVPASAVTLRCTALTLAGNGNPKGNCAAGAITLSTTPQTVASGSRTGGSSNLTATIAFTFNDSWRYPANPSCSLDLTYTITTQ